MIIFLSLLLSALPALAFEVPGFELVYTAPVNTKLQASDLRNPTDVWIEMINGAKKTLDFGEMYASSKRGEPLDRVIEALEKAGERGVKTRFMLEQKMIRASFPETLERLRKIKGLELRIYEFGKLGTDGIVHAKYFVADGKIAYVGSQNFDWRSLKHIHETGFRVSEQKIVKQIDEIFNRDWKAAGELAKGKKFPAATMPKTFSEPKPSDDAFLVSGPAALLPKGVVYSEAELLRLIGEAKSEIRVQLLDYSASYRDKTYYGAIDGALRAAAARGVKVKLMVSHWNQEKPGIDYLKSLSLVPNVEVKIVTIPVIAGEKVPFGRVNHSKIMAIDDKIAWVGTSNWSGGYLDRLRDLEIVVRNPAMGKRLADLHEQLWSSEYSAKIDPAKDYPKPDKGTD